MQSPTGLALALALLAVPIIAAPQVVPTPPSAVWAPGAAASRPATPPGDTAVTAQDPRLLGTALLANGSVDINFGTAGHPFALAPDITGQIKSLLEGQQVTGVHVAIEPVEDTILFTLGRKEDPPRRWRAPALIGVRILRPGGSTESDAGIVDAKATGAFVSLATRPMSAGEIRAIEIDLDAPPADPQEPSARRFVVRITPSGRLEPVGDGVDLVETFRFTKDHTLVEHGLYAFKNRGLLAGVEIPPMQRDRSSELSALAVTIRFPDGRPNKIVSARLLDPANGNTPVPATEVSVMSADQVQLHGFSPLPQSQTYQLELKLESAPGGWVSVCTRATFAKH